MCLKKLLLLTHHLKVLFNVIIHRNFFLYNDIKLVVDFTNNYNYHKQCLKKVFELMAYFQKIVTIYQSIVELYVECILLKNKN